MLAERELYGSGLGSVGLDSSFEVGCRGCPWCLIRTIWRRPPHGHFGIVSGRNLGTLLWLTAPHAWQTSSATAPMPRRVPTAISGSRPNHSKQSPQQTADALQDAAQQPKDAGQKATDRAAEAAKHSHLDSFSNSGFRYPRHRTGHPEDQSAGERSSERRVIGPLSLVPPSGSRGATIKRSRERLVAVGCWSSSDWPRSRRRPSSPPPAA